MVRCNNCVTGLGCRIYPQRPTECAQFYCGYLLDQGLDERWKPSRARLIVAFDEYPYAVAIHVDAASPDAWRKDPYFPQILRWARGAARSNARVVVWQGDSKIVIAPEQELPAAAASL
jgi:hypothetical protein